MQTGNTIEQNALQPERPRENQRGHFLGRALENLAVLLVCIGCGLVLSLALRNLYAVKIDAVRVIVTEEDHYTVGYNLYATGELAAYGYPSIFRAPGFPVFVALSLHVRDLVQVLAEALYLNTSSDRFEATHFMVISQLFVLLAGGLCFYRILRSWLDTLPAIFYMLTYLVNPWTFTAVRVLNYYVMDYVLITVMIGLCAGLAFKGKISSVTMPALGVFFAAASLIRPIYLLSPLLIFGVLKLLKEFHLRKALILTAIFVIAMLGTLLPYSIRNKVVSGRFLLISNQAPWVLWANSVTPFYTSGRLPNWLSDVWAPFGADIFARVTGKTEYEPATLYQYSNQLADTFRREFIRELLAQPLVYLGNVGHNFVQYLFFPERRFETKFWFALPTRDSKNAGPLRIIFSGFYWVATILTLPLLGYLAYRKSNPARLALLLLLYFAASYSFTFLDERYLYGRIPVILVSLAIIPNQAFALFRKKPVWLPSICNDVVSGLSAILLASPVIYLMRLR